MAIRADVAKEADIRQLFADAVKTFGRLDILVNNAGIYDFQPLENITAEHFRRHFDLNVLGLLLASKEAAKHSALTVAPLSTSARWRRLRDSRTAPSIAPRRAPSIP